MASEPENAFETRAVHPARGAGVPGPAAAPRVCGVRVNVSGDDIRLDLVAIHVSRGPRMVERVEHVEELHRFIPAAQPGHGYDDPQSGVRVLAAVLAQTGWIALDVAGILRRLIEWRCEQQQDPGAAPDQVRADRVHRALREAHGRSPGKHRP